MSLWAALLAGLPMIAMEDWNQLHSPEASLASTEENEKDDSVAQQKSSEQAFPNIENVNGLFGVAVVDKKTDAPQKASRSLPKTRLNLQLVGTFTHENHEKASALIASNNKPSKRYFGGEQVLSDATLVKISKDSVVLRRNGRDEILWFPRISEEPTKDEVIAQTAPAPSQSVAQPSTTVNQSSVSAAPEQPESRPSEQKIQLADNQPPTASSTTLTSSESTTNQPTTVSRESMKARLERLRKRQQQQ